MSEVEIRVLGAGEASRDCACGCEAEYRVMEVVKTEDLCECCAGTRLALERQLRDEGKDDG